MKQYENIRNLSNEELIRAYEEMKMDKLPPKHESIIRVLQGKIYHEVGKTVSVVSIKHKIAMEMLERFYEK